LLSHIKALLREEKQGAVNCSGGNLTKNITNYKPASKKYLYDAKNLTQGH
jgi:hypothetical protein